VSAISRRASRHAKLVADLSRAERRLARAFTSWNTLRQQLNRAEKTLDRDLAERSTIAGEIDARDLLDRLPDPSMPYGHACTDACGHCGACT